MYGLVFRGRRYDTGDRLDYIKAIVQLACDRDDLGPDLRAWLTGYVLDNIMLPSNAAEAEALSEPVAR